MLIVNYCKQVNVMERKKEDEQLKGTFVSVIFVALFVFLTWLAVFYIYITSI